MQEDFFSSTNRLCSISSASNHGEEKTRFSRSGVQFCGDKSAEKGSHFSVAQFFFVVERVCVWNGKISLFAAAPITKTTRGKFPACCARRGSISLVQVFCFNFEE